MAITHVASVSAAGFNNGGTTGAITTTGATLLVLSVSWYAPGTGLTISDSASNPYTALTTQTIGIVAHRLYYCLSPTVGAGHTFSATGSGIYPVYCAFAFAGVASYQTASGATASLVASLASGSVTPSANGALIVTGVCGQHAVTDTVTPSGFTLTTHPFVGANNMQGSAAWQVQTTAAAINPTWAFSPSQGDVAAGTAVFLASGAGPAAVETVQPFVWGPL